MNTMIILGAKVNEDGISKTLKRRLDKAIEYYNTNKNINIIVSGGQGSDEVVTEALASEWLLSRNRLRTNSEEETVRSLLKG